MLTLEEQLVFLKQERQDMIQTLENLRSQFGERNSEIFNEKISHTIFCYDSVLTSLKELQHLKNRSHG